MFEDLSKTLKIEPRKLEATEELSFTTDEDTTFTPEIRQKIQLCLDDPSYINKHSLILDLNAEVESFDIVIDQLLKFFKTAPLYADLVFSLIRTTLQYYTTPNEFPVDRIREIQTLTTNDLQWQDFQALLMLREEIFDASKYSLNDAHYIVSVLGKDICYDVEKTKDLALRFMSEDDSCKYRMLGRMFEDLQEGYADYGVDGDPSEAREVIQAYEQMSDSELIESLDPGYLYNLVVEHLQENPLLYDQETLDVMSKDVHLSKSKVYEKLTHVIAHNMNAYEYAASLIEIQTKYPYDTSHFLQSYVFPNLSDEARNRHQGNSDQQHNFLLNCSSLPVKTRLLMFSPEGDILGMTEQLPESNKEIDIPMVLKMSTYLLDNKHPRKVTAVATALTFFDDLPKFLQEEVWQTATETNPDLDWQRYFTPEVPYMFETAVWCAEGIAYYFPDDLYNKIATHINTILATGMKELPFVHFEEVSTVIKEMEEEFGKETFDAEQMQETFKTINFQTVALLQEEAGIDFNETSLREFFILLNILQKNKQGEGFNKIKTFLKGGESHTQKTNRLRSLLSLERGDDSIFDDILLFSKHGDIADVVFQYYNELIDSAERAEKMVRAVSACEGDTCAELARQVRENILNRAQKDLESAVRAHDPREVAAQLENYVVTAKEYVALLQEVGTGKIESVSPEALGEEDQQRMQELLRKNYDKAYPESESAEFKVAVAESLAKSFSNPNTTFRILRDSRKVVSFNRFDTIRDHTGKEISYFGSFNADPAYSGVGGVMLEETIKDRLEDGRPMMAHCDPAQAVTKKYIEDGFVATNFFTLAGKPSFEIWRSQESSMKLESKNKSIEELRNLATVSRSIVVREATVSESYPELQEGKALTRFFIDQGKTYLVFETLPESLNTLFKAPQEKLREAA